MVESEGMISRTAGFWQALAKEKRLSWVFSGRRRLGNLSAYENV